MGRSVRGWLLLGAALAGGACNPAPGDPHAPDRRRAWFAEVSGLWGAPPVESWPDGTYLTPEIMGPGVAFFDADGDGDMDLLQLRMPPPGEPDVPTPNRLLLWEHGRFREAPGRGIEDPGFAQGVAVGDVNADGAPDVYFANYGPDRLYLNRGGSFEDVTERAGIVADPSWSVAATFCDYDGDGDLDLYVARYLGDDPREVCLGPDGGQGYCDPQVFPGLSDRLYRNRGDGTFEEISQAAGIAREDLAPTARGLGVVCVDLTGDGRPDFYVANDREPNHLWVQQPDGTFREEALARGVAVNAEGKPEASMGIAVGDVNQDGRLDLFLTHLGGETNTLYLALPGGVYRDATGEAGMAAHDLPFTGFGCALLDFDLDGDLDAAVVNGRVRRAPPLPEASLGWFWNRYAEPNLVFENLAAGRFRLREEEREFSGPVEVTRGLAWADVDGDGDPDLATSSADNRVRLYRNDAPREGRRWLRVQTVWNGVLVPGTLVRITAGGRTWIGAVLPGSSYESSSEPAAFFGLGDAAEVASLEVQWPDGKWERFPGGAADRTRCLARGTGEFIP